MVCLVEDICAALLIPSQHMRPSALVMRLCLDSQDDQDGVKCRQADAEAWSLPKCLSDYHHECHCSSNDANSRHSAHIQAEFGDNHQGLAIPLLQREY